MVVGAAKQTNGIEGGGRGNMERGKGRGGQRDENGRQCKRACWTCGSRVATAHFVQRKAFILTVRVCLCVLVCVRIILRRGIQ